jgi:hypothetical protein
MCSAVCATGKQVPELLIIVQFSKYDYCEEYGLLVCYGQLDVSEEHIASIFKVEE